MIIASIDIGTNTVLLLVAEVDISSKEIKTLRNEQQIPRIGKGLKPGNPISHEKKFELFKILNEYREIINQYKCEKVLVTATNAFRIASNRLELKDEIKKIFDFDVDIIPGEEEAKFAFLGAAYNEKEYTLIIDIGGGSTELTAGKMNEISFNKSFPVGVVNGKEKFLISDPPVENELKEFNKFLDAELNDINYLYPAPQKVIAIAGTPTTLTCIKNNLKEFDEYKIEGSNLTLNDIKKFYAKLSLISSIEIKEKYKAVVTNREDILLAGVAILLRILETLNLKEVVVSTKGIRYGAIINYLNNNH